MILIILSCSKLYTKMEVRDKVTVFEINSVPYGSTGRIMFQIADTIRRYGGIAYTSFSYTKPRGETFSEMDYQIGSALGKALHIVLAKTTGYHGRYSHFSTYCLIQKIKETKPDVIHLHNIHGWYLNWGMLFNYLEKANIPVVWTLHDCWAFTGHCPHFMAVGCEKWKNGCFECPLHKAYPGCFIDDSKKQFAFKKKCFTGIPNLTIVTPSLWLSDLVKESYLKEYQTIVINNGIDLNKFRPRNSDFRKRYKIENKTIILGVAFDWSFRKGIDEFKKLAKDLPQEYAIVLVGISKTVARDLPKRIISIECTQNQEELAEIYSTADLFVNPTKEDNFPTVNLESLACGTPVVTYRTGGSPESLTQECGKVVPYKDYEALRDAIIQMKDAKKSMEKTCIYQAQKFNLDDAYKKYLRLYQHCMKGD